MSVQKKWGQLELGTNKFEMFMGFLRNFHLHTMMSALRSHRLGRFLLPSNNTLFAARQSETPVFNAIRMGKNLEHHKNTKALSSPASSFGGALTPARHSIKSARDLFESVFFLLHRIFQLQHLALACLQLQGRILKSQLYSDFL